MNGIYTRYRLLAFALVWSVLLGACGSRTGTATPTPVTSPDGTAIAAPTAGPVADRPITFMIFGDPAELRAYQQLVAAYEEQFPGQDVEILHIPDQADYRKRMAADFAAGTPADVVLINYRRYAGFAARGLLEPLGPYLDASHVISASDFFPEAVQPFMWHRQLMCIPQNISSLTIYYNKDLFDQAGVPYPAERWTWEDFLATAKALTRDLDGDGRTDQHGLGIEPSLIRLAPFIWQNRGSLVDTVVVPTELALEEPAALKAAEWFVALQVTHRVVPDAAAEAAEPSEDRFLNGRLAMFFNSRRGVPTYREITAFDWDVAPLPMNRGRRSNVLHSDAYCMASAAPNKDQVWRFIEYANSPEGQTIVARSGRTVPSLISVAQSPAFLDPSAKPANSQVFLDSIIQVRTFPVVENWVEIEEMASEEIERAFYGQVSVAEAMRAAARRTEEYFNITP